MLHRIAFAALACLPMFACGPPASGPPAAAAPPPLPSPAEVLARGPRSSGRWLSALSLQADAARAMAGAIAADTCPAGDGACEERRMAEALESAAATAGMIEALVHVRAAAFPSAPKALGPDEARVCAALGLACGATAGPAK